MKYSTISKFLIIMLLTGLSLHQRGLYAETLYEQDGVVVIEAESFASQHLDELRRWFIINDKVKPHLYQDSDDIHLQNTSANAYIEILPDTRVNHHEPIIKGENFSDIPGEIAVLSYPVYFSTPGTYYVWARAYSTGSEDNGVHIGLNGQWPKSSRRLQFCTNKHQWAWSSAQRTKDNHCGEPNTIAIDIPSSGVHTVMVSMREDGFELDKLLLTQDKNYLPTSRDMAQTSASRSKIPQKQQLKRLTGYQRIIDAKRDFKPAKEKQTDTFYFSEHKVDKKDSRSNSLTLVTLSQIGQLYEYLVYLNDKQIAHFTNPLSGFNGQENYFSIDDIKLNQGDIISVGSNIVNTTSSANTHAQWRALVLGAKVAP